MKKSKLETLKKQRFTEIKKRKNFFPSLIITITLWFMFALTVIFIDPVKKGAVELFLFIFFLATLFTFSLLLANTRRGFLISLGLTFFLVLRYLGVGSLFNFILIFICLILFEVYFRR